MNPMRLLKTGSKRFKQFRLDEGSSTRPGSKLDNLLATKSPKKVDVLKMMTMLRNLMTEEELL